MDVSGKSVDVSAKDKDQVGFGPDEGNEASCPPPVKSNEKKDIEMVESVDID